MRQGIRFLIAIFKKGGAIKLPVLALLVGIVGIIYINQAQASYHSKGMDMGHQGMDMRNNVAQLQKKTAKKPLEIIWPKKGEVVNQKEIEAKIRIADEYKDMVGHIHVYVNGKRMDHASIKEDILLVWDLKEGENTLELALSLGDKHEEGSGAKSVGDSVTFKVKTK
ncbi:MAG: hypothetical protein HZC45_04325 [Deltaproteobacteria bacterium]|nr:hypothetical protein [Deltaproteobacteria bacterium]